MKKNEKHSKKNFLHAHTHHGLLTKRVLTILFRLFILFTFSFTFTFVLFMLLHFEVRMCDWYVNIHTTLVNIICIQIEIFVRYNSRIVWLYIGINVCFHSHSDIYWITIFFVRFFSHIFKYKNLDFYCFVYIYPTFTYVSYVFVRVCSILLASAFVSLVHSFFRYCGKFLTKKTSFVYLCVINKICLHFNDVSSKDIASYYVFFFWNFIFQVGKRIEKITFNLKKKTTTYF